MRRCGCAFIRNRPYFNPGRNRGMRCLRGRRCSNRKKDCTLRFVLLFHSVKAMLWVYVHCQPPKLAAYQQKRDKLRITPKRTSAAQELTLEQVFTNIGWIRLVRLIEVLEWRANCDVQARKHRDHKLYPHNFFARKDYCHFPIRSITMLLLPLAVANKCYEMVGMPW